MLTFMFHRPFDEIVWERMLLKGPLPIAAFGVRTPTSKQKLLWPTPHIG
jgi:hypothetical protein